MNDFVPGSSGTKACITVLVPAFNEVANLGPTVDRLLRSLTATNDDFEIVIVDDGSTDGTGPIADALPSTGTSTSVWHNPRNMGLGYCYKKGIELARGDLFVYIPADNTWPEQSFLELFSHIGDASVITSYATNPEVREPIGRYVSSAYTRTLNLLFGTRMKYFNGLTIYPTQFLRANTPATSGFGFQAETLLSAIYSGFSVVEVGIPIDERTAGGSKAVTLRNIISVLKTVVRMFIHLRLQASVGRSLGATAELDHG